MTLIHDVMYIPGILFNSSLFSQLHADRLKKVGDIMSEIFDALIFSTQPIFHLENED